jgi:hypothetical protein
MKTKNQIIITSILTFFLMGCGENSSNSSMDSTMQLSEQNINKNQKDSKKLLLKKDKEKLSLPHYVISSFKLPSKGDNNSKITWNSSAKYYIDNTGKVNRPNSEDLDANVTLTATLSLEDLNDTKEFMLTVLKESKDTNELFLQEWKVLQAIIPKISFDNLSLPLIGINGSSLTWVSNSPEIISDNGEILGELTQDKNIKFTVTLENHNQKRVYRLPISLKSIK